MVTPRKSRNACAPRPNCLQMVWLKLRTQLRIFTQLFAQVACHLTQILPLSSTRAKGRRVMRKAIIEWPPSCFRYPAGKNRSPMDIKLPATQVFKISDLCRRKHNPRAGAGPAPATSFSISAFNEQPPQTVLHITNTAYLTRRSPC